MAKKTKEAVKDLAKEVKKLRKENEKLGEILDKVRTDQAESHREILALLEERLTVTDTGATAEDGDGDVPEASAEAQQDHQEEPEITDAAKRRAKELGVDQTDVKGTGSGGRVLVKDVEAAAGEKH